MRRRFTKLMAAFALLVFMAPSMVGWGQTYTKVTTTPSDWTGTYVIVADDSNVIFTGQSGANTYGGYASVNVSDGTVNGDFTAYEVEIAVSGEYYSIQHTNSGKYLGLTSDGNSLNFNTSAPSADSYRWNLSTSSIVPVAYTSRRLQYNSSSPRFACYKGTQKDAFLYKKEVGGDVPTINAEPVSIGYNETGGQLSYTIEPNTGASITGASVTLSNPEGWLTIGTTYTSPIALTCQANSLASEKTATVTLTCTYGDGQTITKTVSVTQAGNPNVPGSLNDPYTVAEARAAVDAGTGVNGVYATGIVSQVTGYNNNYHSITYWISDDGTQTDELEVYGGISGIDGWTFNSVDDIQVGATVVIYGNLKKYGDTYEFDLNNQLVSYTAPVVTVAAPTFDPNGGTFTEVQTVTISCETPDVTIYYTTDGTDPDDESIQYSGPITVDHSMTIKARAYDNNDNASTIASATFTINLPYSGAPYARINNVSYLTDGAKVVFAARFDDNANQYYAMTAAASGKPTGVLFTSATSNDLEVLPADIVNSESTYCWTVGVTSNGYTFTNANGQVIGYTSSTNFATGGDNTEWTVALGTSGENAMVPSYEAFNIVNHSTINASTVRAFALNNSHNFGPYAFSNNNSVDYNFSIDIFVQGAEPIAIPSIAANNVAIEYNATSGNIAYSITNEPSPAGTMTAGIAEGGTIANLSLGTIANGNVPFTCDANMSGASRTATITLTYTYNRETVTKDVTITQAANPNYVMTIAEVRALDLGTTVTTKGIVTSCVGTTGYIQDATAAICVFGVELTVGDEIKVTGPLTNFNGLLEIGSNSTAATVDEVISQNNIVNPELMTIAEVVASTNQGWYVRIEDATVSAIDNKNVTIAQGEDNVVVRFANTADITFAVSDVISLDGNIGAYNGVQIANPQNVEVQQNTQPTITIANATVNVPVEGAEGTIEVTYNNFTELAATIFFCDAEGNEAVSYDWIEAEVNDDDYIAYIVSANNGAARTAYLMVYSGDIYSNLVTINQEAYVAPTYAELPFSFNGGRNDIEGTDGLYQEGLGTDYSETTAPTTKLKFDNAGDWLLLQFTERPGALTFNIKGNGFSGGTFTVQTSEDGLTYTNLATYTEITNTQNEEFSNLGENVRFIKWIYTERVNGNVGLGNIVLQDYVEPEEYVLNIGNPEHITITAGYGTDGVLVNGQSQEILSGTEITLALNIEEGYVLETLTIIDENGNIITPTATQTENVWTFNMPNSDVTVNATAAIAPVVTTSTYTLATSIESGKSYIIVGWKDGNPYAMGNQTTNNRAAYGITVDGSTATVASDAGVYEFVISSIGDGFYSIYDELTPGYLYAAGSDKNYLRTEDELDENHNGDWEITISTETGLASVVASQSSNRNVMQFNDNNTLFSCYASASQHPVYLYVKEETSTTTTQTVALAAGTNWFSTNVEITLEDLQAAIIAAMEDATNTTIKAKNGNSVTYNGTRWRGNLTELDVAQMYKIKAAEACSITLEGESVNPAEHPFTIQANATNWIAFPLGQNMTVTDAFAGFAQSGDQIKAKNGNSSTYNGTRWRGNLTELEPGQGYVYMSGYSQDRQLVFPSSK